MVRALLLLAPIAIAACAAGEVPPGGADACVRCDPRQGEDAGTASDAREPDPAHDAAPADADSADAASADASPAPTDAARPDASPDGPPPDPAATDDDRDGVPAAADCDDADGRRRPGAPETPGDGVDSDCDDFDDLPCGRVTDCPPAHYCAFGEAGGWCQPGCRPEDCREGLRCHTSLRACVPDDRSFTCGATADCDGLVCGLDLVAGTDLVRSRCRASVGAGAGGAACDGGDECATGFCLGGQCAELCRADGDCRNGTLCLWSRVRQGQTDWRFRTCTRPVRPCHRLDDCAAGERCLPVADPAAVRGFALACTAGRPGSVGAGGPCAVAADCASGVCLEGGFCFGPCAGDADCTAGRCYEAGVFLDDDGSSEGAADDRPQGFPACLPDFGSGLACDAASACGAGEVCGLLRQSDGRRFAGRCEAGQAGAPAGAVCADGEACAGGVCVGGACAGVCGAEADCAPGSRCIPGRYVVDTRDTPDPHDDFFADVGLCLR